MYRFGVMVLLGWGGMGCGVPGTAGPTGPGGQTGNRALALQPVVSGFERPVYLTHLPGDPRLFVVEQTGQVRVVTGGQVAAAPYVDLSADVSTAAEQGLLGMAAHPDFAVNGYVFLSYTRGDGASVVERFTAASPNALDPATGLVIITVPQPAANHNGGHIVFGPGGFLYLGLGDGGGANNQFGHGQDSTTLLGTILRIDVDDPDPGLNYGIPEDNPFAGHATAAPEIWAYGLRNPWRFAFDEVTGSLFVADVGQGAWEEVSVVPSDSGGVNFGWAVLEGSRCFGGGSCSTNGLVLPAVEYANPAEGCSVTGGFVYRGSALPFLQGTYLYSDFCSGFLRSFQYVNGQVVSPRDWALRMGPVSSFGVDDAGELYVVVHSGGVFRVIEG